MMSGMTSRNQNRSSSNYIIAAFSLILILAGVYLNFFYEVPDGQELTNLWTASFLIVLGLVGVVVSVLWKRRRYPVALDERR
jgi:amino acid transporter